MPEHFQKLSQLHYPKASTFQMCWGDPLGSPVTFQGTLRTPSKLASCSCLKVSVMLDQDTPEPCILALVWPLHCYYFCLISIGVSSSSPQCQLIAFGRSVERMEGAATISCREVSRSPVTSLMSGSCSCLVHVFLYHESTTCFREMPSLIRSKDVARKLWHKILSMRAVRVMARPRAKTTMLTCNVWGARGFYTRLGSSCKLSCDQTVMLLREGCFSKEETTKEFCRIIYSTCTQAKR